MPGIARELLVFVSNIYAVEEGCRPGFFVHSPPYNFVYMNRNGQTSARKILAVRILVSTSHVAPFEGALYYRATFLCDVRISDERISEIPHSR